MERKTFWGIVLIVLFAIGWAWNTYRLVTVDKTVHLLDVAIANVYLQDRVRQCMNGGGKFSRTNDTDEKCSANGQDFYWQSQDGLYLNWFEKKAEAK